MIQATLASPVWANATPLLWPDAWFRRASMMCGSTPSSAMPVATLLRMSCKVQVAMPVSLASSWAFDLEKPLKPEWPRVPNKSRVASPRADRR